jgi:hypothetical protein
MAVHRTRLGLTHLRVALLLLAAGLGSGPAPASPTAFGSWHTSLPKTSISAPSSRANLSALAPLLRVSNQTLYGVDAMSCAEIEQLPAVLEATRGSGVRIFAVVGAHAPLPEYCPTMQNTAKTDLNWSSVGHTLATVASGYPHFVGVYVDDFYAAVSHPAHGVFPRGGVKQPTYSLDHSADALRSALKAVNKALMFIPLVYTEQFGYGLPGSYVIGAPGGVPFAGDARAMVSFGTITSPTESTLNATLRLFFLNDLNAWYLNVSTVRDAIALSVTVNGHELMRIDAASLPNARRFKVAVPAGVLKAHGNDNITVMTQPTSSLAGTGHFQTLDRLSYVWGVSLKTESGAELVKQDSATYYTTASTLLAAATDEYAVVAGHCDAMIAMTSQDPAAYQDADTYKDLMADAQAKAKESGVEVWAGHYSRRGLLWSNPASPTDLGEMIASDKKLGLAASMIWNFPLELEPSWMGRREGIFHERILPAQATETKKDGAEQDATVKLLEFWPDQEIGYPNFFQSYTSSKASGKVALGLSKGRGSLVVSPPLDGCKFVQSESRVCFEKRVVLGDSSASGVVLYQEDINSTTTNGSSCVPGVCPGLSDAAKAKGVQCTVVCPRLEQATLQLDIPTTAAAPLVIELRDVGTVGNMGVSFAIEAPRALDWQFSSACDDPLLLGLYEAAKREFTGQGPLREVCETGLF